MKRWISLLLILILGMSGCAKMEEPEPEIVPQTPVEVPESKPVHLHEFTVTVTDQTCIQDGITIYTCPCGATYEGAPKPAPGHDYLDEIFEPTIASDGFTRHTCTVCGEVVEDSVVPMLPDGIEDGSYFDDAVFLGDSIINTLKVYEQINDCFGDALFLCRPSYAIRHAAENTMQLTWRGGSYAIEDVVAACGAKKLFIQLGMNDVALVGPEHAIEYWEIVLPRIREQSPDIQIFIQAGTPIYRESGRLTNVNMDAYNELLKTFAEENGCFFIDIATPFKDENGYLLQEYCYDNYCHLNVEACGIWARTLKDYLLEHKGEIA